jgi:ketosteroid isomerase-like protein
MAAAPPPAAPAPAPEPAKPPLIDLQKQGNQAATAAINAHDSKKLSELYATDAVLTVVGMGEFKGREAIASEIQKAFDAFPDFKFGVSKAYVKNDVLVQEWVVTGTHKGEYNGIKAVVLPPNRVKPVKSRVVVVGDYAGLLTWRELPPSRQIAGQSRPDKRPRARREQPSAESLWARE